MDVDVAEIMRKVRHLELHARRNVSGALSGAYRSQFKGQGIDFEEVREYAWGDDVRAIDWNITAKTGKVFIKKYREERELMVLIVVDLSGSGDFGSVEQTKRERMGELASVLAFAALKNNDRVGLLMFTDRVEHFVYPRKGRQHVLRIIRDVLFFKPEHRGTDLTCALEATNRLFRRRTAVFIIGDFIEGEKCACDVFLKKLSATCRRHDVHGICVEDACEQALPNVGLVRFQDAETGAVFDFNTTLDTAYASTRAEEKQDLRAQWARQGVDVLEVMTDQPYLARLCAFLRNRKMR